MANRRSLKEISFKTDAFEDTKTAAAAASAAATTTTTTNFQFVVTSADCSRRGIRTA